MSKAERALALVWKWLVCRWFHDKHRCFPEVWGRGLDGPWHCGKCHPCNEGLDVFFEPNTNPPQEDGLSKTPRERRTV